MFRSILWLCVQNLKFVALPIPAGCTQKWAVPGYAHAPFSPKFFIGLWSFVQMDPVSANVSAKFEVPIALPVPEIAIALLGCCCECPILGRGSRRGSGMVPFERALVSSYGPSIVTFPLFLRVSEIGLLSICRFCAPVRHFFPPDL